MFDPGYARNMLMFGLNVAGTAIGLLFLLTQWIWPALKKRSFAEAVVPLLVFEIFRAIGAGFLIPGIVAVDLPSGFAVPTAIGDLIAALLAAVAALAVVRRWGWAVAAVWLFNVVGLVDLLFAFLQVARLGVDPGQLQSMYLVVTVNVPALLVAHILIFVLLLRRREPAG